MNRHEPHAADDGTRMPAEIRIVYPLVLGPIFVAWLWIRFGFGWVVAVAIAWAWLRSSARSDRVDSSDRPRPNTADYREVALATSPGSWQDWRERSIASYGRVLPGVAQAEFASQWVWFGLTRWALLPVLLIALLAIGWFARGESTEAAESRRRLERQNAYLTAFATPGSTADGSIRRDALRQLLTSGAPLDHVDLSDWDLDREVLLAHREMPHADLSDARIRGTDLRGTNLDGADLRRVDGSGAMLVGARLRGADLHAGAFGSADARSIDARHAKLTRSRWVAANLQAADFEFADLREADLRDADLRNANLAHAQLSRSSLENADLRGAVCVDVDLSSTDFWLATWGERDLIGAHWRADSLELPIALSEWRARRTRRIARADGVTWVVVTD